MDVGSGVATTSVRSAAAAKEVTPSLSPAPVSTRIRSLSASTSDSPWKMAWRCVGAKLAIRRIPTEPGIRRKPPGASIAIWESRRRGAWARWSEGSPDLSSMTASRRVVGVMPHITSALASPRSASSTVARKRACASAMARLTQVLVFPTPPLPEVMAMTGQWRTGAGSRTAHSPRRLWLGEGLLVLRRGLGHCLRPHSPLPPASHRPSSAARGLILFGGSTRFSPVRTEAPRAGCL